jgi:hypothetical protein
VWPEYSYPALKKVLNWSAAAAKALILAFLYPKRRLNWLLETSQRSLKLSREAVHSIFMALAAGLGVLRRLLAGLRGHQESGGENGQSEEPERLEDQGDQLFLSCRWQPRPPLSL